MICVQPGWANCWDAQTVLNWLPERSVDPLLIVSVLRASWLDDAPIDAGSAIARPTIHATGMRASTYSAMLVGSGIGEPRSFNPLR